MKKETKTMRRIFILLDSLFLQNFEHDYREVFLNNQLNEYFETYILNLNVRYEEIIDLIKIKNLHVVDFSGEDLFSYIYENTIDFSYFLMPHLIVNFPYVALKSFIQPDKIILNKNNNSRGIERTISCIIDDRFKEGIRREIDRSFVFGNTFYNSDLMYASKDFYGHLYNTFKNINNSNIIKLNDHMKFDLALNISLLKNIYSINSV